MYLSAYTPRPRPRRRGLVGLGQASSSAPGVPAGSVVSYNATFTATSNPFSAAFYSLQDLVSQVVAYLQQTWGLTVTGQSSSGGVVGTPSIRLQVQTNVSYGQLSDLKSILDGALYNAAGAQVTSSQIALVSAGSPTPSGGVSPTAPIGQPLPPGAPAPAPAPSPSAMLGLALAIGLPLVVVLIVSK